MTPIPELYKHKKRILFIVVITALALLFYFLSTNGYREIMENSALLKAKIEGLGNWGPVIIVVSIALAIIMSPIPSAPIALAAGALYGHTWGAVYVLIGACSGAFIAFYIARLLGFDFISRWFATKPLGNWIGSQNALMGIVFFSRLLPFVSFDFISYAAGLTKLHFWRFAIATVAGIAPASYLLAHFGEALSSTDTNRIAIAILLLGLITAVPLIYRFVKKQNSK